MMITYLRLIFTLSIILGAGARAAEPGVVRQVEVAKLEAGEVAIVGKLGRELGTVLAVEVMIVEAPDRGLLKPVWYLMRVVSVEGKPLAAPVVLPFEIYPGVMCNLPTDEGALKARPTGLVSSETLRNTAPEAELRMMSDAEAERFARDYVGSKHRLLAMEVLDIRGALRVLPPGVPKVDIPRFGVHAGLVVLREDL